VFIVCATDYFFLINHFADKPKPPPVHSLNVARLPGIIAQRASKLLDARRQRVIPHYYIGPHGLKQFVFRHHLLGSCDQET
jgi:hypothetical protein